MELINLTGQRLQFSPTVVLEPAGPPPTVFETLHIRGWLAGVPLVEPILGKVEGLPAAQTAVLYVVPELVRQACPERLDLAAPGELVGNGWYARLRVNGPVAEWFELPTAGGNGHE